MLRGAQKQMIVIRTHDSRLFEEAYFVVRKPRTGRPACKEDMLWEANRIIERSLAAAAPAGGTDTGTAPADGDERIAGAGNTAVHRQPAGRHLPFLRRQASSGDCGSCSGCCAGAERSACCICCRKQPPKKCPNCTRDRNGASPDCTNFPPFRDALETAC